MQDWSVIDILGSKMTDLRSDIRVYVYRHGFLLEYPTLSFYAKMLESETLLEPTRDRAEASF